MTNATPMLTDRVECVIGAHPQQVFLIYLLQDMKKGCRNLRQSCVCVCVSLKDETVANLMTYPAGV